ncbi:YchF/TatD family DNA exonuclease [Thalassotalea sp. M1531]|uniref:YchF/TatD family DNA exonuclease n=1 Tax=Thalassotalea algicola TaxID=2716224 RepID=A0A7Y0LBD3_9GAMM|nr:YchF/TatD family DNA exonuclease [Thalassotalea algicola]NMP31423.1 YchF/TatD family DNA exonuclease [Thalassotalea algicola]
MYIDSHCHLDRLDLSEFNHEINNVVSAASAAGVNKMLCVSVTLEDFPAMVEKTAGFDNVYLSCGVHPLNQEHVTNIEQLESLAKTPRVIAVGETGLDYYYAPETKQLQLDAFVKHIQVARNINKPLIIHTRDAREDTINLLKAEGAQQVGGILHCFTESWEMAKQAIDLGFYISFSGIVTFKNAHELREVARKVPADRFLIETDAPYLAPVPHRGKQNQPAYVVEVAKHLASIRGCSVEQIAQQSTDNFNQLFQL